MTDPRPSRPTVTCPHCDLVLKYVPLEDHVQKCPTLLYGLPAASEVLFARLVDAGQARRQEGTAT